MISWRRYRALNSMKAKQKLKWAIYTGRKEIAEKMLDKYPKLIWKLSSAERIKYYGL